MGGDIQLATPLYERLTRDIVSNISGKIPESEMLFAVHKFFREQGQDHDFMGDFMTEEMWTAIDNVATTWVNLLDPDITIGEREEEISSLARSIALTPTQISEFLELIDSKTCQSDRNLIRRILWPSA